MCFGEEAYFGYVFMKALEINKTFSDISIFEKIQNFDDFSGFCSPEFDSFLSDLAIFRLKCNEQHSSIPKSQIKILACEIKLDLQTYAEPRYSCRRNIDDVIVTSLVEL